MELNSYKMWIAKKERGRIKSRGFLLGLLTAIGILSVTITMTALLVSRSIIGIEQCDKIAKLQYALAAFTGCILTARKAEQRKMLMTAITAALFCFIVVRSIFFFPCANATSAGMILGITAAAWIVGGFLGARKKKSGYL